MSIALPSRRAEDHYIWWAFRHHSRTFSLAARLLPGAVRMPIATLYLFCRTVDNLADRRVLEVGAAQALRELDDLRHRLDGALAGRPAPELLWRRLAEVHAAVDLNGAPLYELIDGARWDLEGRQVETRADLVHYADLVGGSIGALMLPFLLDERDGVALHERAARELGIAMQITNIVRDVGEDLRTLDRVYLPRTDLDDHALRRVDLRAGQVPDAYPALLESLMEDAEARYRAGLAGIAALPFQVRTGIRSAARMYREILNEVRARGYDNLTQRAYVPFGRKLHVILLDRYAHRKARLLRTRR